MVIAFIYISTILENMCIVDSRFNGNGVDLWKIRFENLDCFIEIV